MNHYKEQKDEILVDLTLLGNDAAYEELVKRYGKLAQSVAYRITGNRYSAEDAAQDAFVSAWMKLDTLREHEKFSSWLCKIVGNAARNVMFHYKNAIPDLSLDLVSYCEFDGSDEPEASLITDSAVEELREAVDSLTEKIRETIRLHYFDGYSVKEIADMLSLPAGTVKWRLSEGRRQLRKGYGIMEKTEYNENETLVTRVMRQVMELKKWRLKNDKSGFESDYRKVLEAVNTLEDSREKDFALADVLLLGYWFLPGEKNDETLTRIREAAEASHNDEVMQYVLQKENGKHEGDGQLDFMKEKIDWLRKEGYRLALGYEIFWYANNLLEEHYEEAPDAFRSVLEVLEPSDSYFAAAVAALKAEKLRGGPETLDESLQICVNSEPLERSGGKLYISERPGYGYTDYNSLLFSVLGLCDSIILDGALKPGDSFVSSDGKNTYTVKREKEKISVPAGTFEDCTVIEINGIFYRKTIVSKTWLVPGVGIVKQKTKCWHEVEWVLSDYTCENGNSDELLPLSEGNRWKYTLINSDGLFTDNENVYEVVFSDKERINLAHYTFVKVTGYDKSTVNGNVAFIRQNYYKGNENKLECRDEVFDSLELMQKAAKTDFEKKYAPVCAEVTKRIFDTDPLANCDYTEKGIWNHFGTYEVGDKEDGKLPLLEPVGYHIEWKDSETVDFDGSKLWHTFLLDIWKQAAGDCLWNDRFVSGFSEKKDEDIYGITVHRELDVKDDETVTCAAGTFESCRHVHVQLDGLSGGWGYMGGDMDFWFAPGIGLVRYSRATDCDRDNVYELTKYEGTGEGYFPAENGLFRRYEPTDLQGGWHASVEHTYCENDGKIQIIYNIFGTLDRDKYEEALKRIGKE